MFATIFIILVLLVAILLASSLRLRFKFNDEVRFVAAGYLFAAVFFDISNWRLTFRLAGIPLKRLPVGKTTRAASEMAVKKRGVAKRWFRRPQLKWDYAKWILQLLGKVRVRYLKLDISGGFEDPYHTGNATAVYWTAKGMAPKIMSHVNFSPDFGANRMNYKGNGLITLRMYYIIKLVVRLLADLIKTKISSLSILRKKGVSYG
jgi:hypothetical protein